MARRPVSAGTSTGVLEAGLQHGSLRGVRLSQGSLESRRLVQKTKADGGKAAWRALEGTEHRFYHTPLAQRVTKPAQIRGEGTGTTRVGREHL